MYKKFAYQTDSGTEAIKLALIELKSTRVIIPSYTCTDILNAVKQAECEYYIVDCGLDLQIDVEQVIRIANDWDTVIVPHMFGIRADVKSIKENTNLNIIEDLSQCHGLPELGKYADVVVSSTNKSKWINLGGGGIIFSDSEKALITPIDFDKFSDRITNHYNVRLERALELKEAGINLIGKESSYLRGMYFTKGQSTRTPYIPLHISEEKFGCPKIDSYINRINWISIIV